MMLTERSIEIPWTFARLQGKIIDIGSSDAEYIAQLPEGSFLLDQRPLTAPQPKNTSFVYADIRSIPLPDALFDTVLCLSTYEHVGFAHEPYKTVAEPEANVPAQGMREMWRILRPGGLLILTLPFGKKGFYGWLRQWDLPALQEEFIDYWQHVEEMEFYKLQRKEYVRVTADECTDHYDFERCRANSIVCMTLRK